MELYERVAAGDQVARDELIELVNMPLVTLKVRDYVACFPQLAHMNDDLIGEGNLAVVDAANRMMASATIRNVTGYLGVAVNKAIGNFIDGELYPDDRAARRNRQNGSQQEQLHKVMDSDSVIGQLEHDPRQEAELLEMIVGLCESDEERAIVDLRIKGYVDAEIARQLDIPLTTTYMLRRELYARVLATGEITSD